MTTSEAIRRTLFGRDDVTSRTIFTVIPGLYRTICHTLDQKAESRGWWRATSGFLDGVEVTVLEVPQRSGIQDAMMSLDGLALAAAGFVGYCGSLSGAYKVGSVVSVKAAGRHGLTFALPTTAGATLEQVETLLGVDYGSINAELVDMETFDFCKRANTLVQSFCSLLLVTDMPLVPGSRFFEVDYEAIVTRHATVVAALASWLKATSIGP